MDNFASLFTADKFVRCELRTDKSECRQGNKAFVAETNIAWAAKSCSPANQACHLPLTGTFISRGKPEEVFELVAIDITVSCFDSSEGIVQTESALFQVLQ
jgi:hypothetical protein